VSRLFHVFGIPKTWKCELRGAHFDVSRILEMSKGLKARRPMDREAPTNSHFDVLRIIKT
jgi:hypothetical protein